MTRVLLTGGSGFIAAHVLELLLQRGHSVVATVRSRSKADKILEAHPNAGDSLSFTIVEDIAQENAFDNAVKSTPPFEAVIHTASPFHFKATNIQKQLLDPAIIGTTGILKSIKKNAPSVKRVVITSSGVSIINPFAGAAVGKIYSEVDWNPITHSQALENPGNGYRASKTFAERAAWEFLTREKPSFSISTICPPLVFGPIVHYLNSLDALNTSNERIRDFVQGKLRNSPDEPMPPPGFLWVDVRDVALIHVNAIEQEHAANLRFFATAGTFTNRRIVETIRRNFPEYGGELPPVTWKGGDLPPGGVHDINNSTATRLLGREWKSLDECVIDTVNSLKLVGA